MRRMKHLNEEHHESWAIPYGDLVTLLMAFFVVMYSVSVVDAGKYRVLSNALIEAFGARNVDPIQIGDPALGNQLIGEQVPRSLAPFTQQALEQEKQATDAPSPSGVAIENVIENTQGKNRDKILNEIGEMAGEVQDALGDLVKSEAIHLTRKTYWLELEINSSLLFPSGSATLELAAIPVLEKVATVLAKRDARIHVEGHTDDRPISNWIYPSNWELSSGRAATVVNLFAHHGVDPQRMVAIGYSSFHPVTGNANEADRARNRRVAIIVLPERPQHSNEPERLREDLEHNASQTRTHR